MCLAICEGGRRCPSSAAAVRRAAYIPAALRGRMVRSAEREVVKLAVAQAVRHSVAPELPPLAPPPPLVVDDVRELVAAARTGATARIVATEERGPDSLWRKVARGVSAEGPVRFRGGELAFDDGHGIRLNAAAIDDDGVLVVTSGDRRQRIIVTPAAAPRRSPIGDLDERSAARVQDRRQGVFEAVSGMVDAAKQPGTSIGEIVERLAVARAKIVNAVRTLDGEQADARGITSDGWRSIRDGLDPGVLEAEAHATRTHYGALDKVRRAASERRRYGVSHAIDVRGLDAEIAELGEALRGLAAEMTMLKGRASRAVGGPE